MKSLRHAGNLGHRFCPVPKATAVKEPTVLLVLVAYVLTRLQRFLLQAVVDKMATTTAAGLNLWCAL